MEIFDLDQKSVTQLSQQGFNLVEKVNDIFSTFFFPDCDQAPYLEWPDLVIGVHLLLNDKEGRTLQVFYRSIFHIFLCQIKAIKGLFTREIAKNHDKGRDLGHDLPAVDVDTLHLALRDLNRDLRNHLFKQLVFTTPFDLATYIMDCTGMEDVSTGISRILLWDEVRTQFTPETLTLMEQQLPEITSFELHVRKIKFFLFVKCKYKILSFCKI